MPSYIDEEVEIKLFNILRKKYPERNVRVSETNQWVAKVDGMTGVVVGENIMMYARGEGKVIEVGDGYAVVELTERRDAPHPGDEVVSTGKVGDEQ